MTECPSKFAGNDTWQTIALANLAKDGNWPVGGGVLDQSQWFTDAARYVWSEFERNKPKV